MELDAWLAANPPELRGLKAYATELQRLKGLGYTQEQMRAWLATQGQAVSRQAISKFVLRLSATAAQPSATARTPSATTEQHQCNSQTNPSAAPQPEPGAPRTLKERAQAVGDRYLQQTTSPLATALLGAKPKSKT